MPIFFSRFGELGLHKARGAIYQNVEPTELGLHALEQPADLREVVEIGLQRNRTPAKFFDFGDYFECVVC